MIASKIFAKVILLPNNTKFNDMVWGASTVYLLELSIFRNVTSPKDCFLTIYLEIQNINQQKLTLYADSFP